MRRIEASGLCLLAVLAAGALTASAAQAASEGPFYKIAGKRLESGETREFTGRAKSAFTLESKIAKVKVVCGEVKPRAGATIIGSSGANSGRGTSSLEFSECKGGAKEEGLSGCEPEHGIIITYPVLKVVGFSNTARTGVLLVLLHPVTGTGLTSIKLTGASCFASSTTVSGSLIGELGEHEGESVKNVVKLASGERTIWEESAGTLTSAKASLTCFGTAATLEGELEMELTSKEKWGVFMAS